MKRVIALVAALQFVYILDFIMVLPLGPDLARALGFPADRLGAIAGLRAAGRDDLADAMAAG